jgi:hypothetical protein
VYVVEQNRDAQMAQLVRLEMSKEPAESAKILSVLYYTGNPLDARTVTDSILAAETERKALS